MGRPNFGQPTAPIVPHHLHDNGDAVDGEAVEDIQHGLPAKPVEHEPIDPLGFRSRVPFVDPTRSTDRRDSLLNGRKM